MWIVERKQVMLLPMWLDILLGVGLILFTAGWLALFLRGAQALLRHLLVRIGIKELPVEFPQLGVGHAALFMFWGYAAFAVIIVSLFGPQHQLLGLYLYCPIHLLLFASLATFVRNRCQQ